MRAVPFSSASWAPALLAAVMSASGCATKGDVRGVVGRLDAMHLRQDSVLLELRRQGRETADSLGNQSGQLVDLQGNVARQLRRILDELELLKDLSGQNQRAIASIRDQIELIRGSTGAPRLSPLSGAAPLTPAQTQAADDMYQAAMRHFQRGSLTAARIAFNQFLEAYPSDELAPLAHYNLGDIDYQEDKLEDAIRRFQRIREDFPDDAKVPDALYRIGVCYRDLGNAQEARRYWELVVNTYPESSLAELAQTRLDEIGG